MTDNLVIAKKERAIIRESVSKYISKIENLLKETDIEISDIEEALELLNETSIELKHADSEIKKLVQEAQLDAELQTANEYREKITTWRFRANKRIKELSKSETINNSVLKSEHTQKENVSVKLPKLNINKFSGNSEEWLTFWSSFETSIHKNESLEPVDKFNYLRSYLSQTALKSIEGFCVTEENYFKAIDILHERYGKKDILINVHMNKLLNIEPLKYSGDTKSLRRIYDEIQTQIRNLESLEISLETYGNLLSPVILKLFPRDLLIEFNKENINKSYSVKEIIQFLYKQLHSREKINSFKNQTNYDNTDANSSMKKNYFHSPSYATNKQKNKLASACELFIDSNTEKDLCVFCNSKHESEKCNCIQNLSHKERIDLMKKKGICFRCLRKFHVSKNCTSSKFCTVCSGKHSKIICNREINQKKQTSNENTKVMMTNYDIYSTVHLQTLIAVIKHNDSTTFLRVLIDTGSTNSYISKFAAQKLKLKKVKSKEIKHNLFGGVEMINSHNFYEFNLDKEYTCNIQALDQEKICTGINSCIDRNLINTLEKEGIILSDVLGKNELCLYEHDPEEIHLLIGADVAANLFTENVKQFPELGLTAFKTRLGWTIMGKTEKSSNIKENSLAVLSISLHVSSENISELWRLDTLGITSEDYKTKTDLEKETMKYYLETVERDKWGRYEVSLPWIVDSSVLLNNRSIAEKSLYKIENSLSKSNKKKEYEEIFDFWEKNQIIEQVSDNKQERVHFLPHRPVIKESSETTKIRPVFNASAHTKNSPSLNDCLAKGPNLIEIIPRILNKFRKYRIGVSSDIEKAFLQIGVREKDRDFLRFFWFNQDQNLKIYRHCRVVFGLTSSPFLLMATLNHLLTQVSEDLQDTARILLDSFYIDNSLTSLNSLEETEKFIKESKIILASAQFHLRCWRSNLPEAMIEEVENVPKFAPVLGLVWDLEKDSLNCKIEETIKVSEPYTKRKILSITQKIFDPVGFTAPVTLIPKLILQETWIEKIKWDEELPENLKNQFFTWIKELNLLKEIQIPRWLNIESEPENEITLHIFSDASKRAYATCAFLRIKSADEVKIQLVNARSRVAPIKEFSIPRLELLSCLIGARLAKTIMSDLNLDNVNIIYWTDSTTALNWIRREQAWGTFVHNRVLEIRNLTAISNWRHVPGNLNPADLPSRGCSFNHLRKSRWWEGPTWLYLPENEWPQTEEQPDEELINKERKKTIITLLDKEENRMNRYYEYFSSYRKIVRMIAWILRFFHNLKHTEKISSPDISVDEFESAEIRLLRIVQQESFFGKTDPKLRTLRPIEDKNGLLRAKTNIIQRNDNENFRYPVILPSKHPVVQKLIYEKHLENKHAGVTILMAQLRENFWILKSRKCIRNILRKCVICKRFQIPRMEIEPGTPPEDRVREAAVFEVVGVDLAGPLHLSDGTKAWIVLYTCAVYRALHLEVVTSLSTESFMQSLRRFIARRGRPYVIYSDNGKNFVGTKKALASLDWNAISRIASIQKIRWKFNPPSAPWWGGWWERLVRTVKEILRRILGRASLNYEELTTILCDCEQVINSRPITYISEDNRDPLPLTPMMFLQELPSSGVPDIDALDSVDLNRRAKYRQRIREDLRNRFRSEYLGQLRQYASKKEIFKRLHVGDIVLLEDTNKKRVHWPLAKIIEIFPGKDKVVRVAKVKTEHGIFLRPLQRLYPLEIEILDSTDSASLDQIIREKLKSSSSKSDNLERVADLTKDTEKESSPPMITKAGRLIKTPQRLDL